MGSAWKLTICLSVGIQENVMTKEQKVISSPQPKRSSPGNIDIEDSRSSTLEIFVVIAIEVKKLLSEAVEEIRSEIITDKRRNNKCNKIVLSVSKEDIEKRHIQRGNL